MKILGLIGRADLPDIHDGSAALIVDNEIICAIEQERLTRTRYALGQGAAEAARACLDQAGLGLAEIDHVAYGWLPDLKVGMPVSDRISVSTELSRVLLPPGLFDYATPPPVHFINHHYAHAAVTHFTSGFESSAVLVIDGQGEGVSISLYHAKGNTIELLEDYPVTHSLGMMYGRAGRYAGLGGPTGYSGPGKLMGLAPFGRVRQEIDLHFDVNTGKFTFPSSIREAMAAFDGEPAARDVGDFWSAYYRTHLYPYKDARSPTSAAYSEAYYADFAAAVQHALERVCRSLAERLKMLTGEKNLVLSGGCALNCTMNAYLSEQNIFDHIYVFPAANDAGCSIGAGLALACELDPPSTIQPRLNAPDFGRSYTDQEISAAIRDCGLEPQKLRPDELAERVATDLANHKIVAWFRGRDELGPRALGRRSFIANPSQREVLGRLNTIKGREMWRPLAPSILEEQAETVLQGPMEPGLHRYMLGTATIRPEWRAKVPAVVHIDFSCRPHFVRRAEDGAYRETINRFYKKTGIPLVCNTSLNVAGQPLVHTPEQVLEVFGSQNDVQAIVIEDYYLAKDCA